MYKAEQKQRFLEYAKNNLFNESTVSLIENIFGQTEMSEEQCNKDVIDFTQTEVVDMLKGFNSKSPNRLKINCWYLSKYYEWAKNIERITDNMINPFDDRIMDTVISDIIPKEALNQKYLTKSKLLKMFDDLDVSNQFAVYGLYCGITSDELINIKVSDLNGNKLSLITGRIVEVDDLFIDLMYRTKAEKQYFPDGVFKESKFHKYDYRMTSYVLRATGSKKLGDEDVPMMKQIFNVRMQTIKKQTGNKFIAEPMLYKNGLVNYIKEQFAKKDITLKTAILDKVNSKIYTHDKETEQYIREFGSKMTVRMLRREIADYIDLL